MPVNLSLWERAGVRAPRYPTPDPVIQMLQKPNTTGRTVESERSHDGAAGTVSANFCGGQAEEKRQAGVTLVDTRELDEYQDGHAAGAPLMPHMSVMTRAEELERIAGGKDQPIMFICAKGQRSAVACEFAAALGFTDLYNVEGGTDVLDRRRTANRASRLKPPHMGAVISGLTRINPCYPLSLWARARVSGSPPPMLSGLSGTQRYALFVLIVVVVVVVYLFVSGGLERPHRRRR